MNKLKKTAVLMLVLMAVLLTAGCSDGGSSDGGDGAADGGDAAVYDQGDEFVSGGFKATDLDGNEVSQDVFSGHDLTMVHIWATFCGPCIREMPELGEMEKELPDGVQIIGVVSDITSAGGENLENAKGILKESNAGFVNLAGGELLKSVNCSAQFLPTTVFVDGSGHIVGKELVGVQGRKAYESFINGYLESKKK